MARVTQLSAAVWEKRLLERWSGMEGTPVAVSTAEGIRHALADSIVNREMPPGLRLGEERLASLFGVSRTPVREALVALVNSCLVARDGRGLLRVAAVTSEEILEVYAVRVVLEGFAAAGAARMASPAALIQLRQLNLACRRSGDSGDFSTMASDNLRFHAAMATASGNRLLGRFVEEIHNWLNRIPSTTLSFPGRASEAVAQHAAILDAIEERDSERAERLAREHMRRAERIRMAMLVDGDEVTGPGQRAN